MELTGNKEKYSLLKNQRKAYKAFIFSWIYKSEYSEWKKASEVLIVLPVLSYCHLLNVS